MDNPVAMDALESLTTAYSYGCPSVIDNPVSMDALVSLTTL